MNVRMLRRVSTYAFPTEMDADTYIEEQRAILGVNLSKYTKEHKEKKSKGIVVDDKYVVTIQEDWGKVFDAEE